MAEGKAPRGRTFAPTRENDLSIRPDLRFDGDRAHHPRSFGDRRVYRLGAFRHMIIEDLFANRCRLLRRAEKWDENQNAEPRRSTSVHKASLESKTNDKSTATSRELRPTYRFRVSLPTLPQPSLGADWT
jgi:hypothetical protein